MDYKCTNSTANNTNLIRKKIIPLVLVVFSLFLLEPAWAQEAGGEVEITPSVIDDKALASDILEYTIEIKNNSSHKADLYAVVNDLTADGGREEFLDPARMDKTTSLARWIRISRGVIELMPGEKKELPLKIEVNLNAKPGLYHAVISFGEGSNRPMAEARVKGGQAPQVLINIEVKELIVEKAQTKLFKTDRPTYFQPPIKFIIGLNNSGNRAINPTGGIYIYNRRGVLVDEIKINSGQLPVSAGQSKDFVLDWQPKDNLGKFKAKLELEYGEKDKRDLQDVIYFWFLPVGWLAIFGVSLLVFIILLVWVLFRKTRHHHLAHLPQQPVSNGVLDLRKK